MTTLNTELIITKLRHALGKGRAALDTQAIEDTLRDLHPADIADALDEMTLPEAHAIFALLPNARAAEVLDEVSPDTNRYLVEHSPRQRIVELLDILPMDDAAEVLNEVGPEDAAPLLAQLATRDAQEVKDLLTYPEHSAGRLLTDRFAVVDAQTTAAQALEYLRRTASQLETVNVVYVVNEARQLIGVFSVRDLLMARPEQAVTAFANREPITITPQTDQQDAARLISQYDLVALPVINADRHILGIVTVDDMIDVLVAEFEEDLARFVGSDAAEMDRKSPVQVAKLRLPWLMGTMAIELGAGLVISRFDWVLKEVILLASFMPVISAISGNVGLQAAAIVVRGLDTGHISMTTWGRSVRKELTTGLLMALACGLVLGTVGAIWSKHLPFGLVVGAAMTCSMLTAGFMGTVIPMMSKRFGFDPATTAGPFETAFQDVVGFAVFLWLASLLVHWLK